MGEKVTYSIRLDEETREKMREVPNMTDKVRECIKRQITQHGSNREDPMERFISEIVDEYGEVGAYCLYQLGMFIGTTDESREMYLNNVETRFADSDIEVDEARLGAKRIQDKWSDATFNSSELQEVLDDVLADYGYASDLYDHAVNVVEGADEATKWTFWTALQLGRDQEEESEGALEGRYRIEENSFKQTLGWGFQYDDDTIQAAIDSLVAAGAARGLRDTTAYYYHHISLPEYLFDAIEDGLDPLQRDIRMDVRDKAEEEAYLDEIRMITQGDRYLYRNKVPKREDPIQQSEETTKIALRLIQQGTVVIRHRTGRSRSGRRSPTPSKLTYLLVPAVRRPIGDAFYAHRNEENK